MPVEPLKMSESLLHPDAGEDLRRLLWITSPARTARKQLRRQVEERPEEECLALWKQNATTLEVRDKVFDALQGGAGWKCRSFVPDDPFDVLVFDADDGMDALDVIRRIEKQCGMKCRRSLRYRLLRGMTVGALVDEIVAGRAASTEAVATRQGANREARNKIASATRSFMADETTIIQFKDDLAEATKDSVDTGAEDVVGELTSLAESSRDKKIVASPAQWARYNRLLLLLASDARIVTTYGPRHISLTNLVAAACLGWFLFVAVRTGWSDLLFIYAMPFGVASMLLALVRRWQKRARRRAEPFPSEESVRALAARVPGYAEIPYPEHLRRRRAPGAISDNILWAPVLGLLWLAFSPLVLLFQAWPEHTPTVLVVTGSEPPAQRPS